jgi:sugar transferase (PEP-CTERM/EpsH1 system associated)
VRLLYLTPRFPHPELKGEQLAAYHRLVALAQGHEVTLLSFFEREHELDHLAQLRDVCAAVELVPLPKWRGVANVAQRAPFGRTPLQLLYYRSRAFAELVERTAQARRFDVAHAVMIRMLPYALQVDAGRVLDALDSMTLRMRRNVDVEAPPRRWLYEEELRRVERYEPTVPQMVDRVLVASERDRAPFASDSVVVIPNGVDADRFRPGLARKRGSTIVFSGRMSYSPNVRAAVWFSRVVFPLVRASVPDAELVVAGAAPAREVRRLAELPGITVTGFVPSMAETLSGASIAVAPMQSGSGIQNKILEAMACGLPLVTTSIGLGGIDARDGTDLIVEDSAEDFASAVVVLLQSDARAAELGRNARARVLDRYTWARAAELIDRVYAELATP